MKGCRRLAYRIAGAVACAMLIPTCALTQLIEPTRSLEPTEEPPGRLAVYSEPPDMPVLLNGIVLGKTPLVRQDVAPGVYVVTVDEKEKQVRVAPGKTMRLSYHKGDFLVLPEKRPESPKEPADAGEKANPQEVRTGTASRDLEYRPSYWPLNPNGPIY